jgi:exodeoxyribonuclease VII large subunit
MAESTENPKTLADFSLKRTRTTRTRSSAVADPASTVSPSKEGQLGLLFTTPPVAPKPITRVAPPPPAVLPERRVWTVRDLVTDVRQHVEQAYPDLWVAGEISNCRPAPSGHIYFTLKDGDAQLPVVLFRRQAQLLRFRPQDGLAVLVRGRISVYESRGQLQLIAETVEPRGAGALQLAYEQLRDKLKAEGLFDSTRKRQLPAFPRCIGVVTSTSGAVLHDIVKVVRRRHARLNLLIYPALMQGPECARTVAAGIRFFNQHPEKADLILIARGGGSIEDLAGFNDESLARTIAASELPVVSAIGHETDFTIADFVSDLRAPTPSAAAELITAAQHRIEERVASLESRAHRAIRYQIILSRQRFSGVSIPQIHSQLQAFVGRRHQRLDDLRHRLESAMNRRLRMPAARVAALASRLERQNPALRLALASRRLEAARQSLGRLALATTGTRATRLAHAAARLEALSPLAVLSRGYALVYSSDGTLLRDANSTAPGQTIRARLANGTIDAEVTKTS